MASKNLQQLDLLGKTLTRPTPANIPIEAIMTCETFVKALLFAQQLARLEDKEVYGPIDMDASQWTRIKNGTAHFPCDERLLKFLDVVNSDIPLLWLLEKRGFDSSSLRKHYSSDFERRVAELEKDNSDKDRVIAYLLKGKS